MVGIIDLRQRRDRQLAVGHRAGQQNCRHQSDVATGRKIKVREGFMRPAPSGSDAHRLPARSLSIPSITTRSPADSPLSTSHVSPSAVPILHRADLDILAGFTT